MIWDIIRDFLVQYVFGGYTSTHVSYSGLVGYVLSDGSSWYGDTNTQLFNVGGVFIGLGDWLSTTATIIIMCIAVFLMIMLVRWVWRLVTSAFLLK